MYRQVLDEAERILQGGDIGVAPPGKLTVVQGQTVRMTVAFNYRGTAVTVTLRCSIGKRGITGFGEIAYATQSVSIPASVAFVAYSAFADINTTPISPDINYDIEAKISEYPGQTLVKADDVIDVIGTPEFSGFAISDYSVV